jgi:hypothetical protein
MVDQVVGGAIIRVARVGLREEVVGDYTQVAPQEIRRIIERLRAGDSPRELILKGTMGPQELERIVLDLILRGVVETVEAPIPSEAPTPPEDEERWAVIGGDVPTPSAHAGDADRVSIPTPMPAKPPPMPPSQQESGQRQEQKGRAWLYLLLIVVAALLIFWIRNNSREELSPPHVSVEGVVADGDGEFESEEDAESAQDALSLADAEDAAQDETIPVLEEIPVEVGGSAEGAGPNPDVEETASTAVSRDEGPPEREEEAEADDGRTASDRQEAESEQGVLRVLRPAGTTDPILVIVDGTPRGEAPLTLRLPPGRHVVQYRQGDRRSSFAPITIRVGETTTETPLITR